MKRRAHQTLQQRFGFDDADLKSTDHDEIMLWLDKNALDIIKQVVNWSEQWSIQTIKSLSDRLDAAVSSRRQELLASIEHNRKNLGISGFPAHFTRDIEKSEKEISFIDGFPPLGDPPPPSIVITKKWEDTIVQTNSTSSYVVGFADMFVEVYRHELLLENFGYKSSGGPFDSKMIAPPKWAVREPQYPNASLAFEVKGKIDSLGELIRQLRLYQQYSQCTFYVVSPDDKFSETLSSQGFGFVKYPDGTVLAPNARPSGDK